MKPSVILRPKLVAFSAMPSNNGRIGSSLAAIVFAVSATLSLIFFATLITFVPYFTPVCTTPPIFLPICSKVPALAIFCILVATQLSPSLAASKALPSMISPVPLMPAMLARPVFHTPVIVDMIPL